MATSYRPHNPGHDYYEAGAYLITLVARERVSIFGTLNRDARNPAMNLNATGLAVMDCWQRIVTIHEAKGRHLRLHAACCMPDHFHGVIEVQERMDVSIGEIIHGFKAGCTKAWRQIMAQEEGAKPRADISADGELRPSMATAEGGAMLTATAEGGISQPYLAERLKHMSHKQRAAYYATRPRIERPLFDDNYDDTICLNERHLEAMRAYVADNPRRAVMRKLLPQFMQRCLHVSIDGRDYAAFGNLFLLRWVRKLQVFCHRKARLISLTPAERADNGLGNLRLSHEDEQRYITPLPYETTTAFQAERQWLMDQVMEGATVLVTPGISRGEALIKTECLERGIPLIHLQKEAIGPYWKPERKRFEACCNGSLLILAPWDLDAMGATNGAAAESDYARFHNLNKLAEQLCAFTGAARILAR